MLNIGGFPVDGHSAKLEELRLYLSNCKLDSIGLTECNAHWKMIPVHYNMAERTRGWWENMHINIAYYAEYKSLSKQQAGGVCQWSINKGAHRVMEVGQDTRGLGRWAWTRYRGRNGVSLRVVTVYRPVLNKTGVLSVWNQQKSYFESVREDRCPREIFVQDLAAEATKWLATGDQLVIGGDINEDVRTCGLSTRLHDIGMVEIVTQSHGSEGPATYNRGVAPIDAIYVSPTLQGVRCGYDKFVWDHRLVWIEIPLTIAFGHNIPPIIRATARRLKCEDPRIVTKYVDELAVWIDHFGLVEKARCLQEQAEKLPKTTVKIEYDRLDTIRYEAMMFADKHCRKLRMGAKQWSPNYQAAREKVTLWKLIVQLKRGGKVHTRYIQRLMKKCNEQGAMTVTLEEAIEKRATAFRREKIMSKTTEATRLSWLESLCEARAAEGNLSKEQEIRNRLQIEEQRRNARIIRRVNGKLRSGSVTSVVAPDENGIWKEVTERRSMETALLDENRRRFTQASDTPFLQPPLLELVGALGTGPAAEDILRGTFTIPEGVDEWAANFIPFLAKPTKVQVGQFIGPEKFVSVRSHCEGWRKAKERTSSGPSGITFAHFKAGLVHPTVTEFETIMTSIPYETGISPERWQHGTNVMLEKQAMNFRVDKLRAILLYEADFNQNNKKIGREMMYTAEDLQAIAPEQFGSRSGLTSIDHSLNKRLTYDIIRQKKRPSAVCSNDAKSCYDRIVHSVASLAMQRVGAPVEPIICMFTTIQNLEHRIRTVYGDSDTGFTGKLFTVPIQGVGQGNGAGPQIWAVVSTPIFDMLRSMGFGAHFQATISQEQLHFVGFAIVDDADLVQTTMTNTQSFQEVAVLMQQALTAWEGGLRATGGAIVPEKSHWYLIDFVWDKGLWRYKSNVESPATLKIRDCTGTMKILERLEMHEARRTLGVRLAPDGNNKAEVAFLRQRVNEWADRIRTGHLPRRLVWESMHTTIMKSIQYPLPATTLSEAQCRSIMAPLLAQGLSGTGVVRTMKRDVVYGPLKYQGLGVSCLYTLQMTEHIVRILKYCKACDHLTGQLIRHTLEATKLEVGCEGPLLVKTYAAYKDMVTETWLTHTWEFMGANNIQINDGVADLTLEREHDQFLIRAFQQSGYKGKTLGRLNVCRLYLQTTTVADITTGCGKYITQSAWTGRVDLTRPRKYDWPNQGNPTISDWKLWQEAVTKAFCDRQQVLRKRLGRWLHEGSTHWYYSLTEERIYYKEGATVTFYPRATGSASRAAKRKFHNPQPAETIPKDAYQATVEVGRSFVFLTGWALFRDVARSEHDGLHEFIQESVHQDAKWAVERFQNSDDGATIADAIRKGTAIGVSDGSFKDKHGTACWILQGETATGKIKCSCVVPGIGAVQSAYRSELAGLYGMITMINAICAFHDIISGTIELGCDGIQALRHVDQRCDITNPKMAQFDLLSASRNSLRMCPIKVTMRHVKGHQDNNWEAVLDRWANLNIEADDGAKEHWYSSINIRQSQHRIFAEIWPITINGTKICTRLEEAIKEARHAEKIVRYWEEMGRFGSGIHTEVDWETVGMGMASVPRTRRHWVTKHVSGFCSTGKMMQRWGKRASAKCPRCDADEDAAHVWKCRGHGADDIWTKAMENLKVTLVKACTHPNIIEVLIDRLTAWRYDLEPSIPVSNFLGLRATIECQDRIGWQAMLEGTPVIGWAEVQQRYLEWRKKRRTGKRWLLAVIQKMWDVAWDLWDHRNGILHNKEVNIAEQQQDREVEAEFSLGPSTVTREAQRLFRPGLRSLLTMPPAAKQAWIIRIRNARTRYTESAPTRQAFTAERSGMVRWLQIPPYNHRERNVRQQLVHPS